MAKALTPDICVIGAGSGGLSVAAAAAAFGVSVVLVEKGRMGGDCLNAGCVPSKALIAAGKAAHAVRKASRFGVSAGEPVVDYGRVHAHIHETIATIAPNDSVARFTALGVTVIEAEGRFVDERTLMAGGQEIRARRFVVATGSSPFIPPIPGLDGVDFLTNESVFDLTRLPARLAIIGGGPIGVELAQAFRRLGSEVIVIEALKALGREDPEIAAVALRALRDEGVDLREATKVVRVEQRDGGVRLHLEGEVGAGSLDATHVLVAVGRAANVSGLGLEAAGIAFDRRGIDVDRRLRTSNRRAYAIGDVAGGLQFTHVAGWHAGLVIRSILFRLRAGADARAIPRATFTDPELAAVGLSEEEARRAGHAVEVLRWPFAENDRAVAERRTAGLVKIVADKNRRILGVAVAGAGASELIAPYAMAVAGQLSLRDLASVVHPYPTLGEAGKRAAMLAYAPAARSRFVRGAVRFLSRFG